MALERLQLAQSRLSHPCWPMQQEKKESRELVIAYIRYLNFVFIEIS